MTREENYKRGAAAEDRIMKQLSTIGEVEQSAKGTRYPDLIMKLNGSIYAIECKSVLSFHDGGEPGCAKISSTEMNGMNELEKQGMIPCLIVEIRPRSGESFKPCFFIEWADVQEKYKEGSPSQLSLRLYWILEKGQNLNVWLQQKSVEAIPV